MSRRVRPSSRLGGSPRANPSHRPPGRAGVALLTRGDRALIAISDGTETQIVEESASAVAARWKGFDRPGAAFAMADAKPLETLLVREGGEAAGDLFDVCLAQYVLSPGVGSSELEPMAFQRLGQQLLPDKDAGVSACTLPEAYEIANVDRWLAERASSAHALAAPLSAELQARPALEKIYREIERPLTRVLARMELAGVAIDVALLREMSARMEKALRELEQTIWAEAGEEFNVNSPVKLGQILFEKLGYPVLKKTAKTRSSSTGFEVLSELAERGLSLPKLVLEFREISKLKGTYVDALPAIADAEGRVHTSFRQTVAATGRLSSSDPNLQNIPIRTEAGRQIRKAFIAPPGRCSGRGRLLADRAAHPRAHVRRRGAHPGLRGAAGHPPRHRGAGSSGSRRIWSARRCATRPSESTSRCSTAWRPSPSARSSGVSTSEAKSYVDSYFAQFPRVRATLDGIVEEARRTREVTTLFGRVRPIPDIAASNPMVRANAERMALNAPFQGSAADIIKIAMIRLESALSEAGSAARPVLQVHDELVLEAPTEEIADLMRLVPEVMEGAAQLKVRLDVDVGSGSDWLAAK